MAVRKTKLGMAMLVALAAAAFRTPVKAQERAAAVDTVVDTAPEKPAWRYQTTATPSELSLPRALELARRLQPRLRQAQADVAAANARAGLAKAPLLPQINGVASYQRTTANFVARPGTVPRALVGGAPPPSFNSYNFFNFSLSASQLLYDFGQSIGRSKAAQARALAQVAVQTGTSLQVDQGVRVAYANANAAKALLRVASTTLDNQRRHLTQIQGFVEIGTRPRIDLLQAQTNLANARLQLIRADNDYANAKALLNQAIGVEWSTGYELIDAELPALTSEDAALEVLVNEALQARPELEALAQQLGAQHQTVRSINGSYAPSLGATATVSEAGTQPSNFGWNWNVGASLTWPLYLGGLRGAQLAEAKAQRDSLLAQLDSLRQQVRVSVQQAQLDVLAAIAARVAAAEVTDNTRERLLLAEGRYQAGVGNVIELADAQLALSQAEAQQVQADYGLMTARANLQAALGRP